MINFLKTRGVIVLICLLMVSNGIAQNLSRHVWYFGNSTQGIRFNRVDNSASLVTNQFTPFRNGGSAAATDPTNANLLFYTDGSTVIDRLHQIMPGGTGLMTAPPATAGNQPVALSAIPGTPNQYYIFSNNASFTTGGTIEVAIVDLTQFGNAPFPTPASGTVLSKNSTAINLVNRSEAMITIPHANGTDYWLITHQNSSDTYNVTLISSLGFTNLPAQSGVTGISIVAGNFAYHAALGKIAVTPQDANRNVAILNFDNTTGALTFDQFVSNSADLVAQSIYDTEWSPNGRFLYISKLNDVLQYDLSNPTNSLATVLPGSLTVLKSYGLQYAPDSSIYHLYEASAGVFRLGKLSDPDSLANLVVYSSNAFNGVVNYQAKQFPSFADQLPILPTVIFTPTPACANNPVQFYPTVTPAADSLIWNFGDGSPPSSEWSPVHPFTSGGNFNVTVTPFLAGQAGTAFSAPQSIATFNLQLSLVQDTTACSCSLPFPQSTTPLPGPQDPTYCQRFTVTATSTGGTSPKYQWYGPAGKISGATSLSFQPDSAGYYWIVATDGACSTYSGVNIREYNVISQQANFWYFGQKAGIDFNQQPPAAVSNPVMTAPEGTATISDRNGQVLFFTDGNTVWNRDFTVIGTGIGGDLASAQSSLIVPIPGDETMYYIFTTQDVGAGQYELRYSLYDIKLNNGAGGLVQFNQLLFSPSTERITSDGNWLIAHEYGNNSFRAYPITTLGIGNPVITSIGSDHSFSPAVSGEGYMKVSGGELAVALSNGTGNFVEIFDIDSVGVITNFRSVNLNAPTGEVYGIEFSGDKIFATVRDVTSSQIFEILDTLGAAPTIVKVPPVTVNAELGAIQVAPNGQLMVAVNGAQALGAITVDPDPATASTFTLNGFPLLGGTQSTLGLPNFIQNIGDGPMTPSHSITGLCLGSPTDFTASGTDPIDKFIWSVQQGATVIVTSDSATFSYTLPAAGDYTVTLQIYNGCGYVAVFTETITIVPPPQNPLTVIFCTNTSIVLDANPNNAPGLTYQWYNGATTETITVSRQGNYPVTISSPQGCVLSTSVFAIDARTPINLGNDQTICSAVGGSVQLDAQINTANHDWYLSTNGGVPVSLGNNTQLQNVSLNSVGVFSYIDTYTNPITTCISKDTITFTVNQSPVFSATATPIACNTSTGQIRLNISASVTSLFTYNLTPPAGAVTTVTSLSANPLPAAPILIPPTATLTAGSYSLEVVDQISSCATTAIVAINTNAFTVAAAQADPCPDARIRITPSASNNYSYIIRDAALTIVDQGNFNAALFTTINTFPSGNYNVELTFGGCTSSANITIAPTLPQVPVTFVPDVCNSQVTVNPAGLSYSWTTSPSGGISGSNTSQLVTLIPGSWQLTATVTDATFTTYCPATNNITIKVDGPVTPDIVPGDLCQDEVMLTASVTPAGTYDYLWRLNGVDTGTGNTLTTTLSGDYELVAVNSLSGCDYSTTETIFVLGKKTVTLTSELPCGDQTYMITATPSEPVSSAYTWTKNGSAISGTTNQISVTGSGVYKVSVSIIGCPATYELPISTLPSPVGSLPTKATICNSPANPDCDPLIPLPNSCYAVLNSGSGFTSYSWAPNGETDPSITVGDIGIYIVTLENSFGCTNTDQTEVVEKCIPSVVAPTAFRPGNGIANPKDPSYTNGDFWVLSYFIEESDFQVFIYNRWGELVFQSKDRNFRWNGSYNNSGQVLPAGTYTYILKYKSVYGGDSQEQRGGVVLMR